MTPVFAQALAEKGALDGAITGVSHMLQGVVQGIEANPYWLILLGVVLFFLLKKRR